MPGSGPATRSERPALSPHSKTPAAEDFTVGESVFHRRHKYFADVTSHATDPFSGVRLVVIKPWGRVAGLTAYPAHLVHVDE